MKASSGDFFPTTPSLIYFYLYLDELNVEAHMRPLRVTILDLVTKGPTNSLYARVMNQNLASIMPQVVGVWCEELVMLARF